jgi:GT2 family glycosyltransferase
VGGFDPSYPTAAAEDRDICDRLRLRGYNMVYVPEAVVYHVHSLDMRKFWSQHFGYGRGAFRFWRAHQGRSGRKIRIEPPGFYWGMLTYPLRLQHCRAPLAVAALLLLSQVANFAGFLWEWGYDKLQLSHVTR